MKNFLVGLSGALALMLVGVQSAMAQLPAAATAAFTQLETDAGTIIDAIWPIVALVTVAFVLLKLFKRGANRV